MTFDAKQLKAAVEAVCLPEDMGERLRKRCLAANAPGERNRRGHFAPRKALLAGIAACFLLIAGFGVWKSEGLRFWHAAGDATGGVEQPVVSIRLCGSEELEEMREVALSADDGALDDYLRRLGLLYRVTREDLLAFLETLESLPYLPILEGEPACIEYLPEFPLLTVTLEGADGDRVELDYEFYFDNPVRLMEFLRDLAAETPSLIEPFTCCDGRVTVYVEGRSRTRDGQDFIIWHATVDGILVRVWYYTDEPDRVTAEEVFGGLTVCRFGDWGNSK